MAEKRLIDAWIGEVVTLTIRQPAPIRLTGVLRGADSQFVQLEQEDLNDVLIPLTSVLHITIAD